MMTLFAAAALAAAPAPVPVPADRAMQHEMQMDGHMAGKDMDCCKHCCDGMHSNHEHHGSTDGSHSKR